jgi:hypothetical protein
MKKKPSVDELTSLYAICIEEIRILNKKNEEMAKKIETLEAKINDGPQQIIKNLTDGGRLESEPINGQYKPYETMPQFIQWCFNNGYGDLSPQFLLNNIFFKGRGGDKLRSIKEYIKKAKKGAIKTQ